MKRIYIIRHGQTEWNLARRLQGRLDSPLTQDQLDGLLALDGIAAARYVDLSA